MCLAAEWFQNCIGKVKVGPGAKVLMKGVLHHQAFELLSTFHVKGGTGVNSCRSQHGMSTWPGQLLPFRRQAGPCRPSRFSGLISIMWLDLLATDQT